MCPPTNCRRSKSASGWCAHLDDSHFDFLAHRYGHLREFAPAFLQAFTFRSNLNPDPLLQAVELLRTLNQERRRAVPDDVPLKFIPASCSPGTLEMP
jgi:hypothetical protein